MTTAKAIQCANCQAEEAAYHDTVGGNALCSGCAKEIALGQLNSDGEIQSIDEYRRERAEQNRT